MATKKPLPAYLRQPSQFDFDAGEAFLQSLEAKVDRTPPAPRRNAVAVANDTVIEAANAVASGAKSIGEFISPGNRVSQFIDENIFEPGEAAQSDVTRQSREQFHQEVEAADSISGELAAVGRKIIRDPLLTMSQALGSFVVPGAAVKGAGGAARLLGMGQQGVARAGLAGGATAGAALAGGDAAGTAYELVLRAGGTPEQAEAAAREASAIPAAVGAAGGMVGAERLLAGAGGARGTAVSRALKTGAVEGVQEAIEEGVTQFEGQRAAVPYDPTIDPSKGVAAAAGMGAALGFGTGAGLSAITRPLPTPGDVIRQQLQPETGPSTRATNAGIEAAAAKADSAVQVAPLGISEEQEAAAMTAMEQQANADLQAIRAAGRADKTGLPPLAPRPAQGGGQPTPGDLAAPSAEVIDAPMVDRILTLREQLADERVRETVRGRMGPEGLQSALYYLHRADNAKNLPEVTRERMLALAEEIVSQSVLRPIDRQAPSIEPTEFEAPGQVAVDDGPQAIAYDTTPTGRVRVDAEGNATAETAADAINTRNAAARAPAPAQLNGMEAPARKASAVYADPNPRRPAPAVKRAPRTKTADGVLIDPAAPTAAGRFVDRLRRTNTPAARAFVQDFDAGRITLEDVGALMAPRAAPTADERIAAAAAQAPQPGTGLILNPNGEPFPTKGSANLRAKKEGGTVVEFLSGYAVRSKEVPSLEPTDAPVTQPRTDARATRATAPTAKATAPAGTGAATAAGVPGAGSTAPVETDGVRKLRERLESGGAPFIDSTSTGDGVTTYRAKGIGSIDTKWDVPLELTADERKAAKRAEADLELADTPEERAAAKKALSDALTPAARRAVGVGTGAAAVEANGMQPGSVAADLEALSAQDRGYRAPADVRSALEREGLKAADPRKDTEWIVRVADYRGEVGVSIDAATGEATISGEYMGKEVFTRKAKGGAAVSAAIAEARAGLEEGERRRKAGKATKLAADALPALETPGVAGEPIDKEWTAFSPESGTRGVPRADMPQVKAEHRGALVNFLAARGITHETDTEVDPKTLKPTQAEFSPKKVQKARAFEGGQRSILVSADDHVLDGHHQWMQALEDGEPIKAIRLDAPIDQLLLVVKEFPNAGAAAGATEPEASSAMAKPEVGQPRAPEAPSTSAARAPTAPKPADTPAEQWAAMTVSDRERLAKDAGLVHIAAVRTAGKRWENIPDTVRAKIAAKMQGDQAQQATPAPRDQPATSASPAPAPAEPPKPARLTDAGEELIRNRRGKLKGLAWDDVAAMNDTLKVAQVVKANVWPRPDYAKMVDDGAPAWKAAALKAVYDKLATAPVTRTTPTDADLKAYIETLAQIRDTLGAELDRVEKAGGAGDLWKTLKAGNVFGKVFPVPTDTRPVYGSPSPFDRGSEQGKENNRRALLIGGNGAVQALQFSSRTLSKVRDLLADGFPAKQEAWQKSYEVRATEIRDSDVPEAERTGQPQQRFAVYEKGSRYRLAKGGQDGGYATQEQAEAFARTLTTRKRETLPPSRGLDLADVRRTGPDWRGGKDVTAEQVMAHFGFRGVNLGEYVKAKQGMAQLHLNHVFDAFSDLADLLGVPPRAMSLNGTLGVAIGAQGSGKALAHFVPGVNEINITRDSGAGALAHEFGHAVDHYFATQHGRAASMAKRPYLSAVVETMREPGGVRPEVMEAMRVVMKTINSRPMSEAEVRKYMEDQRALNRRRMDRWVAEFKGNKGADPVALAAVAEKLKQGDIGEPQDGDVETNLAEFMRASGLQPGNIIAANAFTTAYRLRDLADEARFMASHIPQVDTDYAKASAAMDAKKPAGSGYWSTPWEKFARAFETFAMDALKDRQRESLYLSGLVDSAGWSSWAEETGKAIPYPAGAERLEMQQAFQKLVDTIETREDDAGNVAMFSRGAPAEDEANALRALAENDELFALPRSAAATVESIAADIDPDIVVTKLAAQPGQKERYRIDMPDGRTGHLMVRAPSAYGPTVYAYDTVDGEMVNQVEGRPGENTEAIPDDIEDVFIDVSKLKEGGGGAKVYAIAAAFAHNTDRVFIGDPAGLSSEAMRRRPEQMLSSALRYGTTAHLAPHPRQIAGDPKIGVPPLPWVYGDHLGNIRRLIDLNLRALENAGYDDAGIRFDPATGNFQDPAGRIIDRADISDAVDGRPGVDQGGNPRDGVRAAAGDAGVRSGGRALAGRRTLARAAVLRALLREEGREGAAGGRRDGLLARLAKLGSDKPQAVGGLFSRDAGSPSTGPAEEHRARIEALAQKIAARWDNAPRVIVARSMDDPRIPEWARERDQQQRAGGAMDAPKGLFSGDTAYLFTNQIGSERDAVEVLFHEVLGHYGLRGAFPGAGLETILDRMTVLQGAKVRAKAKAYGLSMEKLSERRMAAEEVLAELAQSNPQLGWVQKAIAAIRTWLRQHAPGFSSLRVTDDEIVRQFLLPARGFVERGRTAKQGQGDQMEPAFSRGASATSSEASRTAPFDVADKASNFLAHYRGMAMQALGRRQIIELWEKDIPALRTYGDLVQRMDAEKNESAAEADQLADAWGKLPDEKALAELMHDATLAHIDADPQVAPDPEADLSAVRRLRAGFNSLTPEAQAVYRKARDTYAAHHEKVRLAIRERIERSELSSARRKKLLERMDDDFFTRVRGVYFPLSRFGSYVVVVRDGAGDAVVVSRGETINEAQATRAQLLKDYPADKGFRVGKVIKDREFNAARDGVGRGFMAELFDALEKQGADESLQDAIGQLYLASLPDLSWAKHGIHRKGTPGFSQDARRAFAQNVFHGARYLARLRYADRLQTQIEAMQKHVDQRRDTEGFDSIKGQQVVDEMVQRHQTLMNPKAHPLSTALTSFGFIFHLGLSPASALVNMLQTPLVALPQMAAKWGYAKASAALLKASREAAGNRNDISKTLSGDELRAYDEAVKAGVIDITQANDLAGIAQGEDAKVVWRLRPVMKWASFMFHHAERFNRQVTFVAAYRLAREGGATHDAAQEQAVKSTYDGHFDYSASNRPRIMQGNIAKVALLFKQFAQNMIYALSRQAYLAVKAGTPAERTEARKALGGLLVAHAAAAGSLGLPVVGPLLAAASMLGSSDDEPWDAETALRNMLADELGLKPAEVLARGLSRLTPWDISGRVGLDRLILPDVYEGLEGARYAEAWATSALGPVAGIGVNAVKGLQLLSEGRIGLGLEAMLPAALRGPMKALRYGTEGAIDKSGISIKDEVDAAAIAGQAMGFSPSEVRLAAEAKGAIYRRDGALQERRQRLLAQHSMAIMAGDAEAVADAREEIQGFNEKNPDRRIGPLHLRQSVVARRRRIEQAEHGVYLPPARRGALAEGRFALEE